MKMGVYGEKVPRTWSSVWVIRNGSYGRPGTPGWMNRSMRKWERRKKAAILLKLQIAALEWQIEDLLQGRVKV